MRPTSDRIRETLFNWLRDSIQGEICLDVFAGSGALGFESLSRGASQVDFVEQNTVAARSIRDNIERLDVKNANVYCADALAWLDKRSRDSQQYGLVFLDPPFQGEALANAIAIIENANIVKEDGLVYIEKATQATSIELPNNWTELKTKKAGAVNFGLYRVAARNK
ncbi:MAG: hypothetical protein DHS20C12_14760 [Pseudohongiella sp.]|nr:MAG: hypothetical protein DHS20C12_14760 [Pseudohongiella sp.]